MRPGLQRRSLEKWSEGLKRSELPPWYVQFLWVEYNYDDVEFPAEGYGDFGHHDLCQAYWEALDDWPPALNPEMEAGPGRHRGVVGGGLGWDFPGSVAEVCSATHI